MLNMIRVGSECYTLLLVSLSQHMVSFVSQHKYTKDLIDMAWMTDAKPFDTPMELNAKYNKNSRERERESLFLSCSL